MIDNGYLLLGVAAVLPVIASIILFYADRRFESRLSYPVRQIIIGVIFGGLAILGTEWGINLDGYIVNCRDAAVLCAGLLFGGPAGIIAGIIGGVERYVAVAWGAGAYTQIACSLSTILAGFFAAAIRRFPLDNKRPNWAIGFLSGLVMESFHMISVVVTHLDDVPNALNVILGFAPFMLTACAISVMLATIAVNIIDRGGIKRVPREKKGVRQTFQGRLLVSFVIAFTIFSALVYAAETVVCTTANSQYLEQNLTDTKQLDLAYYTNATSPSLNDQADCRKFGSSGYILISQNEDGKIVSSPYSFYGKSMDEIGLGQAEQTNPNPSTHEAASCSNIYNATVNGIDCECMDTVQGSYRLTAVYPIEEGYLDRNRSFLLTLLIQILLFAVVFALTDIIVYRHVVFPIRKINDSLEEITDGNLSTVVDARSSLEFVQLSDGINATVDALQRYTREAKKRLEEELELARNIQHAALPKHFPPYPNRKEFDIFACMDTAKEVGGDFYDFFFIDNDNLCFLIADVSGKGIPAAMFMMRAKTQLKDWVERGIGLDEAIKNTNNQLCEDNESNMFVTLWCGSIDLRTGLVTYVNAGHNSPLVRYCDGRTEFIKTKHNFALGALDFASYDSKELQLKKGDTIYLYTDGITEAETSDYELFGNDRLTVSLSHARWDSMQALCESVRADLDDFVQGASQADDITMLAIRYNGFIE